MTQDELKFQVAEAAIAYTLEKVQPDHILGIGTGSTANFYIDLLGAHKSAFKGAVASSEASAERLRNLGIPVFDLNTVTSLSLYVDGADEANAQLHLIKGGGGALTREKIVVACAEEFLCIADESKWVNTLGHFPLPVEVIPMAQAYVSRQLVLLGGNPVLRENITTDNGNVILDVHDLNIHDAPTLETHINQITGVVTNGLFACRGADKLLLSATQGVKTFTP